MSKIYVLGAKGKLQRGGWVQGRERLKNCGWGQEKEDQGVLGGPKNLVGRRVGTGARLHHLHGRLAVNCLSQNERAEAVANPGKNRAQLHSESSFVITMSRGLYNVWKMPLVALSAIR